MIAPWTLLAAALPALVVAAVATSKAFRNSLPDAKAKKANESGAFSHSDKTYECGACGQVFKSKFEGDKPANRFSGHFASGPHKQIMQLVNDGHAIIRNEDGKRSFYSQSGTLITIQNVGQQENGHKTVIPEQTF